MKKPHLTKSQVHSSLALLTGAAIQLPHITAVITEMFPGLPWLKSALTVLCLLVTALSRALDSRKSGTGTGLVNNGPDVAAQAVQESEQAGAAVIAQAVPPQALTGVTTALQVIQAVFPDKLPPDLSTLLNTELEKKKQELSAHADVLKAEIANTPLSLTGTLLGLSAKSLAEGHADLAATQAPQNVAGNGPEIMVTQEKSPAVAL